MNKRIWMLMAGAAIVAVSIVGAPRAMAQVEDEVRETDTEYCGICEAKKVGYTLIGDWFKFGADARNRVTHRNNATTLDKSAPGHEELFTRQRIRLWGKATPVENLEIGARLVWEWRLWCKPDAVDNTPSSDVTFDELYIKASNVAELPLTIIAGRQNMRLGDGWLVFEGTPLDGSRTIYFDAIRMIYDLADSNTTVSAILMGNRAHADAYIKPFNDGAVEQNVSETDDSGVVLYVSNASQENMTMDGYFIYAHRGDPDSSNTLGDIYTLGGRVAGNWSDNVTYRAETALQFGKKENMATGRDSNICGAMGMNTRVTYLLQDERDTAVHAGYEYRSGDKDPNKNFDMLWGRYPRVSNLTDGLLDSLEGLPAAGSNLHRLNVGASLKPFEPAVLLLGWHVLFADNNNLTTPAFGKGYLRGNLVTSQLKIKHNEHMASTVTGELFMPGSFYSNANNDVATFARYELMLTW